MCTQTTQFRWLSKYTASSRTTSLCGSFRPTAVMIFNCKETYKYTSSIRLFERKIKYLQHRLWMRQLLSLIDFNISLNGRKKEKRVLFPKYLQLKRRRKEGQYKDRAHRLFLRNNATQLSEFLHASLTFSVIPSALILLLSCAFETGAQQGSRAP